MFMFMYVVSYLFLFFSWPGVLRVSLTQRPSTAALLVFFMTNHQTSRDYDTEYL